MNNFKIPKDLHSTARPKIIVIKWFNDLTDKIYYQIICDQIRWQILIYFNYQSRQSLETYTEAAIQ